MINSNSVHFTKAVKKLHTFSQRFWRSRINDFLTPSNSASWTVIALRVRSRSFALSARFFPPSMPAEVTAKARYTEKPRGKFSYLLLLQMNQHTHLELFIDALQALQG